MRRGVGTDGEGWIGSLWEVSRADVTLLHLPRSPPQSWEPDQFEALGRVLIAGHGRAHWDYPGFGTREKDCQGNEGGKSRGCCPGGGWRRIWMRGRLLEFPSPGFKTALQTSVIGWLSFSMAEEVCNPITTSWRHHAFGDPSGCSASV